jgi:hypothetical protein
LPAAAAATGNPAQVAGAVAGPFAVESYISRTPPSKQLTYHVACGNSVAFGISSSLLVPLCRTLPVLVCLLFVFGATQAATETLVYIHVAKRLEQLGKHVATHVSMAMLIIALALGAGLGNMLGGALQNTKWAVQVGVTCAVAGATGMYGVVVSVVMMAIKSQHISQGLKIARTDTPYCLSLWT